MKTERTLKKRNALANHPKNKHQVWVQEDAVLAPAILHAQGPNACESGQGHTHYSVFKDGIHCIMQEQDDFLSELYVWMQECEVLDKAQVTAFFVC